MNVHEVSSDRQKKKSPDVCDTNKHGQNDKDTIITTRYQMRKTFAGEPCKVSVPQDDREGKQNRQRTRSTAFESTFAPQSP